VIDRERVSLRRSLGLLAVESVDITGHLEEDLPGEIVGFLDPVAIRYPTIPIMGPIRSL
jgi:hypothetical protein